LRFFLFWLLLSLLSQYKKEKSNKEKQHHNKDERKFHKSKQIIEIFQDET